MPNRESPYPTVSKGMRTLLDSLPSEKEKAFSTPSRKLKSS